MLELVLLVVPPELVLDTVRLVVFAEMPPMVMVSVLGPGPLKVAADNIGLDRHQIDALFVLLLEYVPIVAVAVT